MTLLLSLLLLQSGPLVRLDGLDERVGHLVSVGPTGVQLLDTPLVPWGELRALRTERSLQDGGAGWVLVLADGSRLPGRPLDGTGERLRWRTEAGLELTVPADHLHSLLRSGRPALPGQERDILYLSLASGGGDERRGVFEAWTGRGVRFADAAGSRDWPWAQIQALVLVEELPPVSPLFFARSVDGARIPALSLQGEEDSLRLALPWGEELLVPWVSLLAVIPYLEGPERLSEREPHRVETPPIMPGGDALPRGPWRDRSECGGPLRSGNQFWEGGFALRAPTTISWHLHEGGTLVTQVALVEAEPASPIRFAVLWNGREVAAAVADPASPLHRFEVALVGEGELALVAEVEGDWPWSARGAWLDPVLFGR